MPDIIVCVITLHVQLIAIRSTDRIQSAIDAGHPLNQAMAVDFAVSAQYEHQIRRYYNQSVGDRDFKTELHIIWNPSGGSNALDLIYKTQPRDKCCPVLRGTSNIPIFELYDSRIQDIAIITDYTGWFALDSLLTMAGSNPRSAKIPYHYTPFKFKRVYITTDRTPITWYGTSINIICLLRLVTSIIYLGKSVQLDYTKKLQEWINRIDNDENGENEEIKTFQTKRENMQYLYERRFPKFLRTDYVHPRTLQNPSLPVDPIVKSGIPDPPTDANISKILSFHELNYALDFINSEINEAKNVDITILNDVRKIYEKLNNVLYFGFGNRASTDEEGIYAGIQQQFERLNLRLPSAPTTKK